LTELVVKGNRGKLCEELAPLDEQQRAALAESALTLYKLVDDVWSAFVFEELKAKEIKDAEVEQLIKAIAAQKHADWRIPRWTAGLALLGVCDRKTLTREVRTWFVGDLMDMPQRMFQILNARRPAWLGAWIKDLRDPTNAHSNWCTERALIRAGALPANNSDDYIQRMASGLHDEFGSDDAVLTDNLKNLPKSHLDALLADPELLEHEVWRLFEVDTLAFNQEEFGWLPALLELSAAGKLDRQRLLRSSVHAMALPFKQTTLSGLGKFHNALKPTLDERAALGADYLVLLGCQTPVVVGQGLEALEELAKAKRLNAAGFLSACVPALQVAKKGHPLKSLKLVKLLIKEDPASGATAARAVIAALGHESADVQEAAIDLLESLRAALPADILDEIRTRADQVAASLRHRLDTLTASQETKPTKRKPATAAAGIGAEVPEVLRTRAAALRADLRAAAGVDAALACVAAQTEPIPTAIEPRCVPRRGSATAVVPLASLDELIEAVTAFVERVEDVMEIERILDGISRFYLERPADFDQRVAPLRKRIEAVSERHGGTVLDRAANLGIAQVIRQWLGMPPFHREFGDWWHLAGVFFRERTRCLVWRMREDKEAIPLLALPTQSDGWLDPVALAERLKIQEKAGVYVPDGIDLAQALLRLTPDGRKEALKKIAKVKLHDMDVVRFALGEGTKAPVPGGYGGRQLTFAAVHARLLIDDPSNLDFSGVVVPQVGLRDDGSVQLAGPLCEDLALPGNFLSRLFSWEATMPGARDINRKGDGSWGHMGRDLSLQVRWQGLVWPANRRPVCLLGSLACDAAPDFLRNLLDRDMTWHDEEARLASWALGSDVPAARGLVTDALIEAIGERTLDPALLGKHLAAILGSLKLNRVAAVLAEVARVSPLHHWSVFRTIDSALGRLDQAPADLHHLLTVLLETATLTGQPLSDAACALLRSIPGGGKTTKLAKQLLLLEASPEKMGPVRTAALAASVARAERWASLGFAL
jgi:hypothetical protein